MSNLRAIAAAAPLVARETPPPPLLTDPQIGLTRLAELLVDARRKFSELVARYPGSVFDDRVWRVSETNRKTRSGEPIQNRCAFADTARRTESSEVIGEWPGWFADAFKAFVVLDDVKQATTARYAVRYLMLSMRAQADAGTAPAALARGDMEYLTHTDLDNCVALMRATLGEGTLFAYAEFLERWVTWLNNAGVAVCGHWRHGVPDPKLVATRTLAGAEGRVDRLPTERALRTLARVYQEATAPQDRLTICFTGLQLVGGFRVSEVQSLPERCVVRHERPGMPDAVGLRYWNAKTGDTERAWAVRWLSPLAASLAEALVAEVRAITAELRRYARAWVDAGDRIPLADQPQWIERADAAAILGLQPTTLGMSRGGHDAGMRKRRGVGTGKGSNKRVQYARESVERKLVELAGAVSVEVTAGTFQARADHLFLVPRGWLLNGPMTQRPVRPGVARPKATTSYIPDLVDYVNVQQWLNGQVSLGRVSVLDRFADPADAGEPLRLRTHALRHFINVAANRGGMTAYQITLWMHRVDDTQTPQYLASASASDIAEIMQEGVRGGRLWWQKQAEFEGASEERRSRMLTVIEHGTLVCGGYCGYPLRCGCPNGLQCGPQCDYWYTDRSNPKHRSEVAQGGARLRTAQHAVAHWEARGVRVAPWQKASLDSREAAHRALLSFEEAAPDASWTSDDDILN